MLLEVFFESEFVLEEFLGDVFADEAEVPRFVGVAADGFFALGIAEDEAKLGEALVDFGESAAVGNHFFVVAFDGAVGFDDENVDGETGVVLGVADFSEILFAIFGSEFRVGRPSVPDFLLFLDGAVGAVEFDLDAVFQEVCAEGVEVC